MKVIYLMSGPHKVRGFDEKLKISLSSDLENKRSITFISSSPSSYDKNDLFVYGNQADVCGIKNYISEISGINEFNLLDNRINMEAGKEILSNSDVIYLLGGNPITQIEYLKKNDYDEIIKNFEGIILGTSAGAMNLSNKVYYSKDEDYDSSFFYDGMGIIDITIDPHFDVDDKEQVSEALSFSHQHEIIGLPNQSAIKIADDNIIYINDCYKIVNGELYKVSNDK